MRVNLILYATFAACGFACAFLQSCAAKLPTYSWTTQEEALTVIRQRHESIKTIQAACDIILTDPNGQSLTLNGALVARNPGWIRMRAWKFNSAVFDLTMTPDGLWVMQGDSPDVAERMPTALDAAQVAEAWSLLLGGSFDGEVTWAREKMWVELERFVAPPLRRDQVQSRIHCWVKRRNLLPLRYQRSEREGATRSFDVRLDRYRMINGIAFAHEIDLTADAGRIVIRLRDVTLNEEPTEGAFKPPAGAVKQP